MAQSDTAEIPIESWAGSRTIRLAGAAVASPTDPTDPTDPAVRSPVPVPMGGPLALMLMASLLAAGAAVCLRRRGGD